MRQRPVLVAALSGLALALGLAVLLQQFAVRPLTAPLLVGLVVVIGGGGAGVVRLLERRSSS